jgi:peroxiredoxin
LGVDHIFGLSVESGPHHVEVKGRLHLPYDLLSDEELAFVKSLGLPTFEWEGQKLLKRVTIAVRGGKIVKIWYPVFPPDESANQVVEWLKSK